MKKSLYSLFLLFISSSILAQDFALTYAPTDPGQHTLIRDLYKTSDGKLIAGYDLITEDAPPIAGIMKTEANGAIIWSKTLNIPGSAGDCTFEVAENAAGNYYLWGLSQEEETLNMQAILSEISADGEMLWSKKYDFGSNESVIYSVNKLHVLPSGELQMMIAVYSQVIILRTTATGDILWGKSTATGPPEDGGKNPGFEWLTIPDDGGMCASKAGSSFSLLRYSETGELLWNRTYSIGSYTHGKTIARSPNGNILVSGFIDFVPHIMELSEEDGSIVWIKTINGETMSYYSFSHLTVLGDDIYLDFTTLARNYILKLSETGEILEIRQAKHYAIEYNKIERINNSEIYLYGSALDADDVARSLIFKTDDLFEESCIVGSATPMFIEDFYDYSEYEFTPYESDFTAQEDITITLTDKPLKAKYLCESVLTLEDERKNDIQFYPNPASSSMTLQVSADLIESTYTISDLSGKVISNQTIKSENELIDVSFLNNGHYLLTVYGANQTISEKITILK
ncbi:MAG: hypothetical protein ACI8ZM_001440 [Crocinitomix sp.]|jgi:hypothetical protein